MGVAGVACRTGDQCAADDLREDPLSWLVQRSADCCGSKRLGCRAAVGFGLKPQTQQGATPGEACVSRTKLR